MKFLLVKAYNVQNDFALTSEQRVIDNMSSGLLSESTLLHQRSSWQQARKDLILKNKLIEEGINCEYERKINNLIAQKAEMQSKRQFHFSQQLNEMTSLLTKIDEQLNEIAVRECTPITIKTENTGSPDCEQKESESLSLIPDEVEDVVSEMKSPDPYPSTSVAMPGLLPSDSMLNLNVENFEEPSASTLIHCESMDIPFTITNISNLITGESVSENTASISEICTAPSIPKLSPINKVGNRTSYRGNTQCQSSNQTNDPIMSPSPSPAISLIGDQLDTLNMDSPSTTTIPCDAVNSVSTSTSRTNRDAVLQGTMTAIRTLTSKRDQKENHKQQQRTTTNIRNLSARTNREETKRKKKRDKKKKRNQSRRKRRKVEEGGGESRNVQEKGLKRKHRKRKYQNVEGDTMPERVNGRKRRRIHINAEQRKRRCSSLTSLRMCQPQMQREQKQNENANVNKKPPPTRVNRVIARRRLKSRARRSSLSFL